MYLSLIFIIISLPLSLFLLKQSHAVLEQPLQNGEQSESEKAQFLAALQSSLEIFVNRMRSNSQRGRPIANDSSVQSLFTVISNMHPQLLKYQQELEDGRSEYLRMSVHMLAGMSLCVHAHIIKLLKCIHKYSKSLYLDHHKTEEKGKKMNSVVNNTIHIKNRKYV